MGTEGGVELVEFTEGMIFAVERQTDRRLFGVISVTDGDPVGLTAFQTSFWTDRVLRRNALVTRDAPDARRRWVSAAVRGHHGWRLSVPAAGPGHSEVVTLRPNPVPPLEQPEAEAGCRNLRVIHDRFMGSHVSGATGDGLGGRVDGLSRA